MISQDEDDIPGKIKFASCGKCLLLGVGVTSADTKLGQDQLEGWAVFLEMGSWSDLTSILRLDFVRLSDLLIGAGIIILCWGKATPVFAMCR